MKKTPFRFLILSILVAALSGCSLVSRFTATQTPTLTATLEFTPTPEATLTPTPPPSAAVVNGLYIWMDDYNGKREQLRAAYQETGETIPEDQLLNQEALDSLIEETLFLSAAERDGLRPSPEEIDARIQTLTDEMGGSEALKKWQDQNHYSEDSFRRALERELAVSSEKEKILAEKLSSIEQVHAYQITSTDRAVVQEAKASLDLGFAFPEIAKNYDALTGGDMNWIPRGVIFYPELEDAIFALDAGAYTDIIEFDGRFYLFYVAEKSSDHAISAEVKQSVQHQVLTNWLKEQREQAKIENLVNE